MNQEPAASRSQENTGAAHLIGHGKTPVVASRTPDVTDEREINQIDEVEPPIEKEPSRLPVVRNKVRIFAAGEAEGVDEEEAKDDEDAPEDAPPELLVHHGFDRLLPLDQVLDRQVEGVQSPDIERRQGAGEREDDEQHEGPCNL